jgi:hypothetical protein
MADPRTPFLGVPQGNVRMETPDGVSFTEGDGRTMNTAYDASRPWPATLIPGDFDTVKDVCRK